MTDVISNYSDKEFATVVDYLTKTAAIVARETKYLRLIAVSGSKKIPAEA